jgi:hypothetical protein
VSTFWKYIHLFILQTIRVKLRFIGWLLFREKNSHRLRIVCRRCMHVHMHICNPQRKLVLLYCYIHETFQWYPNLISPGTWTCIFFKEDMNLHCKWLCVRWNQWIAAYTTFATRWITHVSLGVCTSMVLLLDVDWYYTVHCESYFRVASCFCLCGNWSHENMGQLGESWWAAKRIEYGRRLVWQAEERWSKLR